MIMRICRILTLLAMVLLAAAGCQKPYEKHYDLSVDSNGYVINFSGKSFPVYVYCSAEWTASLSEEVDWVRFDGETSGTGNGLIRLTVEENWEDERSVYLVFVSGVHEQRVNISQRGYEPLYHLTFDDASLEYPSGSYHAAVTFQTNVPSEVLERCRPSVGEECRWISGLTGYTVLSDDGVKGTDRKVTARFSFAVLRNEDLSPRSVTLVAGLPQEFTEGMDKVMSLELTQNTEAAELSLPDTFEIESGEDSYAVAVRTNLQDMLDDVTLKSSADFISDLRLVKSEEGVMLEFSAERNSTSASRKALVSLLHRDLDGVSVAATVTIVQK